MKYQDELIKYRIEKAYNTLDDAIFSSQSNKWEMATNRTYYAMFYAVTALLLSIGLSSKTHKGVNHLFSENFIKTNLLPLDYGKFYNKMFDLRIESDYEDYAKLDYSLVPKWIDQAKEFIKTIDEYLRKQK